MRLDQFLSQTYSFSRTKAKQLVESGYIKVNGQIASKVSLDVDDKDSIEVLKNFQYASLGGDKLAKAIIDFSVAKY